MTNESLEEFFKTSIVTFEILHAKELERSDDVGLRERITRLRRGIIYAAEHCGIDLASPTYRFLVDHKPWYGTEDFV